jgi:hypothetical protein
MTHDEEKYMVILKIVNHQKGLKGIIINVCYCEFAFFFINLKFIVWKINVSLFLVINYYH